MTAPRRAVAIALAVAAALAGACTLFDSAPPGRTCKVDKDCFTAQGERCAASHVCVAVDAGAP